MHFVKYTGKFWEFENGNEDWCGKDLKKIIIDTFIIGLSACNILNVYLDKVDLYREVQIRLRDVEDNSIF